MKKNLTSRLLWVALGYLGSGLIVALSLAPASLRPHSVFGGYFEHWIAYALVGAALGLGYRTIRLQLFALLALTAGAATLEVLQTFIPGRSPEVAGFVASSLGAWFGLAVGVFAPALLRAAMK